MIWEWVPPRITLRRYVPGLLLLHRAIYPWHETSLDEHGERVLGDADDSVLEALLAAPLRELSAGPEARARSESPATLRMWATTRTVS